MHAFTSLLFSAFAFVSVLSVVVFVHEFGHFQMARWCGVGVDTFSIGFGRTLLQWRDKHGVIWKIGALPLGGYVKFLDDADPTSLAASATPKDQAARAQARARGMFHAQPTFVRALVAFAGPGSNFLFSISALAAMAMILGVDLTDRPGLPARVDAIETGSPAAKAGFQLGDVVVAVNGAPVNTFGALRAAVINKIGAPLKISVRRANQVVVLTAIPSASTEVSETGRETQIGHLGLGPIPTAREIRIVHQDPISALGTGASETWRFIASTGGYLANIATGKASANQIAGPVGIFQMSGQVAHNAVQQGAWWERAAKLCASLASLAALLSVAVGFMNLLPVPVLDGGLILFCAIETIRGRPLDEKAQEIGMRMGLAAIASLFLFATWNDLQRLNVLELLRGIGS